MQHNMTIVGLQWTEYPLALRLISIAFVGLSQRTSTPYMTEEAEELCQLTCHVLSSCF